MAPKAKKGKKEPELQEPEHDPSWDRVSRWPHHSSCSSGRSPSSFSIQGAVSFLQAIISGVWERSITALPGMSCCSSCRSMAPPTAAGQGRPPKLVEARATRTAGMHGKCCFMVLKHTVVTQMPTHGPRGAPCASAC
jgi:hypothetical protein